ncbi:MAG: hypothetical protein WC340_00090 [Kiritimatiellia bacterium]
MIKTQFWVAICFLLSVSLMARDVGKTGKGVLTNPGFEQFAADGKSPLGWSLSSGASVEKSGAIEGDHCLQLTSTRTGCDVTATLSGISTEPGKYYRLVYRVKGKKGADQTTGFFQRFKVETSWDPVIKDGVPQQKIQQLCGCVFQDTFNSWQERTLEFFAPSVPSAGMVIRCCIEGPGTAWFDDFRLTETQPPMPPAFRLTITHPYYRGTIFADTPVAKIQGVAMIDSAAVTKLEMTMGLDGVPPVFSRTYKVKKGQVDFSIPSKKLENGEYQFRVRALSSAGQCVHTESFSVLKVAEAPHTVRVREDNVFLVDGRPFFPIGLWKIPDTGEEYDEKGLAELSRAGINTFLIPSNLKLLKKRLDQVDKYQIKPIVLVGGAVRQRIDLYKKGALDAAALRAWEESVDKTIAAVAGHPALLGYHFIDEPLWCGIPLQPIRGAYDYFRRADPHHPVYINEAPRNMPEEVAPYAAASDMFGLDIYPVPEDKSNNHSDLDDITLSCVGKYTDRMREAVNDRKPVVMTLQGFAWKHLSDKQASAVYPTFEQSRFMAYDAIVHGAKGIMYWGTHYIQEKSFWQVLFRVTSELRDMSSVFTGTPGRDGHVAFNGDGIVFIHQICGKDNFIIAVNENQSEVKATFTLKGSQPKLHVLFENRTVTEDHGVFSDVFPPQSVHVYSSTGKLPPPTL